MRKWVQPGSDEHTSISESPLKVSRTSTTGIFSFEPMMLFSEQTAMRVFLCSVVITLASANLFGAKKTVSPETSAGNELVDIVATISLSEEEVTQKIGADPGKGIVLLQVRVIPKTDKSVYISPDDFILLAHDDGERTKPYEPAQIAADGALVVKNTADKSAKKTSGPTFGIGPIMGGGGGASPGNSKPVVLGSTMDSKSKGDKTLLQALEAKQLPAKDTSQPLEGYLYFSLDGKHKLKNLAVLYRGQAGHLDLEFEH